MRTDSAISRPSCPGRTTTEKLRTSADSIDVGDGRVLADISTSGGLVARGALRAHCGMMAQVRVLHSWFRWFERHSVPSISRIIAVAAGASVTATVVGLVLAGVMREPVMWLIASQVPLAIGAWALLGKIEGDDRDRAYGVPPGPTSGVREPRRPLPASSVEVLVPGARHSCRQYRHRC
ncbi:MAG: hypothetical protein ACP5P1_15415 [Acidimicrobiales bacterium]